MWRFENLKMISNSKGLYLTLSFLLSFLGAKAQEVYAVEDLVETHPHYHEDFHFPKVIGGLDSICKKINDHLIENELGIDRERADSTGYIFYDAWRLDEFPTPALASIEYDVIFNGNLLSINFRGEGCGAFCEFFDYNIHYSLLTGEQVFLSDFFTPKGSRWLKNQLASQKQNELDSMIKEVKFILDKNEFENEDEEDYYTTMLDLYEGCDSSFNYIEYNSYSLNKGKLKIKSGRCAPHAIRNVDELGDFNFQFSIAEIRDYLKPEMIDFLKLE
jgi:hypothetical protein